MDEYVTIVPRAHERRTGPWGVKHADGQSARRSLSPARRLGISE